MGDDTDPDARIAQTPQCFCRARDHLKGAEHALGRDGTPMVVLEVARPETPLGEVPVALDRKVGARPTGVCRNAALQPERVVGADAVEVDTEDEGVEIGHVRQW